jgi:hypothetical protein
MENGEDENESEDVTGAEEVVGDMAVTIAERRGFGSTVGWVMIAATRGRYLSM